MILPSTPRPKASVADPSLIRPDWTKGEPRRADMLWLDKNENSDPALAKVVAEVLASLPPETLYTYPETAALYRKLADWTGLAPENLVLAAGSDGAIRAVFEAFVSPGDVVLHTDPTFAMYPVYCRMYGADAHALEYRARENGPELSASDFIEAIERLSPRLICLPNPDSPTGTVITPDGLSAIIDAAGNVGAVMLVDEAYHPFYGESVIGLTSDYPHLVVTRSTGKAWGMAGFRIGYSAAGTEMAAILHKVRPMYHTNTIAIAAFTAMLDHASDMEASVERLNAGKGHFLNRMSGLGFRTLNGHGSFLHVAFGQHAGAIHAALADVAYYRLGFSEPCLRGFSRFSSTTIDRFDRVADTIEKAI